MLAVGSCTGLRAALIDSSIETSSLPRGELSEGRLSGTVGAESGRRRLEGGVLSGRLGRLCRATGRAIGLSGVAGGVGATACSSRTFSNRTRPAVLLLGVLLGELAFCTSGLVLLVQRATSSYRVVAGCLYHFESGQSTGFMSRVGQVILRIVSILLPKIQTLLVKAHPVRG